MSGLNREFGFLVRGVFHSGRISLQIDPEPRIYDEPTRKLIDEAWENARLNPNLNLFNGNVLTLRSAVKEDKLLDVRLGVTDYKSFYGTNVRNFHRLPKDQLANAIAVCGTVLSSDQTVIMCNRSRKVAEGQEEWHVIGGTMEISLPRYAQILQDVCDDAQSVVTQVFGPFKRMQKELEEELALTSDDIEVMVCTGVGKNLKIGKPEFLMTVMTRLDSGQLVDNAQRAVDRDEHTEILAVPVEEIPNFCSAFPVAPIGKASLLATFGIMYGLDHWHDLDLEQFSKKVGI